MLTPLQNLQYRAKLLKTQARDDKRLVYRNVLMRFQVAGIGERGEREHIGWYPWPAETGKELRQILQRVFKESAYTQHQYVLWLTSHYERHSDILPHEDVTDLVRAINVGL